MGVVICVCLPHLDLYLLERRCLGAGHGCPARTRTPGRLQIVPPASSGSTGEVRIDRRLPGKRLRPAGDGMVTLTFGCAAFMRPEHCLVQAGSMPHNTIARNLPRIESANRVAAATRHTRVARHGSTGAPLQPRAEPRSGCWPSSQLLPLPGRLHKVKRRAAMRSATAAIVRAGLSPMGRGIAAPSTTKRPG